MKRLLFATLLASLFLPSGSSAEKNLSDYILTSYHLSQTQDKQFARDGRISPFWEGWKSETLDYIDMTPESYGWVDGANTFSGNSDAELIMRSAYSDSALYLYFEIHDNIWQPPAGFGTDGIDFVLDKISSQEIRDANPFDLYIQPSWGWTLTYYSIQYQVNIGSTGATVPGNMHINYFSGSAMVYNVVNLTQLPTDYTGWNLDMGSTGDNIRWMEWKIPWTWVGCGGGVGSMPAPGRLIAMAGGYNDGDSPNQTGRKSLRWKERDPFNRCDDKTPPHIFCDAWGDISIGPINDTVGITHRTRLNVPHHTGITKSTLYDLTGRVVTRKSAQAMHPAILVVGSPAQKNGRISRLIPTAR